MFNHGSLFSGIGGFDLAAEWMGWNNVFHCEIDPFCRKVLHYYWPNSISYEDIRNTDFTVHRGTIDILTGGFPCQPFSVAGKRRGTEDDRYLWPEMLRAIREIKPDYVVGENVHGLLSWSNGLVLEQVLSDLEADGYEAQTLVLPAAGVNAPHKRNRVWIVAKNTNYCRCLHGEIKQEGADVWQQRNTGTGSCNGIYIPEGVAADPNNEGLQRSKDVRITGEERKKRNEQFARSLQSTWENFPTQPPICSGDDGISERLDGITFPKWRTESVKAYGNAIVPQVAYAIFKAIEMIS